MNKLITNAAGYLEVLTEDGDLVELYNKQGEPLEETGDEYELRDALQTAQDDGLLDDAADEIEIDGDTFNFARISEMDLVGDEYDE